MANSKKKEIKENLILQLKLANKTEAYFQDMIDDYMRLYDLKNKLFKDIKKRGEVIEGTNGNGFKVMRQNESIQSVLKVNAQMLKILNDLGLKEKIDIENNSDDDYL